MFGPDGITGAIDGAGMLEEIVGITRSARAVDGASANGAAADGSGAVRVVVEEAGASVVGQVLLAICETTRAPDGSISGASHEAGGGLGGSSRLELGVRSRRRIKNDFFSSRRI